MATNKNAVLRYNTLDKCFSNFGRKYYFQDLLDKVNEVLEDFDPERAGIKTRQLRDDICFMKSDAGYSAPIVAFKDGKKAYYRYEERDFSINNSPLNPTEAPISKMSFSSKVPVRVGFVVNRSILPSILRKTFAPFVMSIPN